MDSTTVHPERGVLVFDGDCAFCSSTVRTLIRLLPAMPSTTPYQWAELEELGLTVQEAAERVWYVDASHQYGGHLALTALLVRQPAPGWRFLGRLLMIPPWSWLAGLGYAWVARNRHLLPGGTPACRIPR
jgi:predicted DCC family thiol-disulfide oxidoreductase YuxK